MDKTLRIGTIKTGGRYDSVYLKIKDRDNYISFTGVIAPLPSGNALGGCGQIDMEFEHRRDQDNDKRYFDTLIKADDIKFAKGWNKSLWYDFLDIWKIYHMKKELPKTIKLFIKKLPETDKIPAWC